MERVIGDILRKAQDVLCQCRLCTRMQQQIATTNANDIKSKTIFYYVGSNRGIGTVLLNENSDYEIYKVNF